MAESDHTIILRAEAMAAGLKHYFTGRPCVHGHVTKRYVTSGNCVDCRPAYYAKQLLLSQMGLGPLRETKARWSAANLEKVRVSRALWKRNNPEMAAVYRQSRHARMIATKGHHRHDIADILRAQRKKCAECRVSLARGYHVDHIHPVARGGSNERRNLQILCAPCNQSKGAKLPLEWAQRKGRLL